MLEQWRDRSLVWWSGFVCRRPWWILAVTGVLMLVCLVVTASGLEFQSDRNALLSPDLDWNQRFDQWRASFPGNEDFYVVVDSGDPMQPGYTDRLRRAQSLVEQLGDAILKDDHIADAVWKLASEQFSPKSLRLAPMEEFEQRLDMIVDARSLLTSPTPRHLIDTIIREWRGEGDPLSAAEPRRADGPEVEQGIDRLTQLIEAIRQTLLLESDPLADFGGLAQGDEAGRDAPIYLLSENGRLLFIRVTPRKAQGLNAFGPAIEAVRAAIDAARVGYPELEAGLTGVDVIEADETDAATRDSTIASVVAAALITVLLIAAFDGWRVPLLAMVSLLVGVSWSFGFLTVAIGHLQVLSVVFTVILLGLGIAYGIHIASRIELVRHRYPEGPIGFTQSLTDSLRTVGPGVLTGAVTTAAAFCTTVFTDFQGVVEMGLIAGVGVILCLASMFSVYPALLRVFACDHRHFVPMRKRKIHFFATGWVMPFSRHHRVTLAIAGLITAGSLGVLTQMRFDYDLLKLQPRGVDSVHWQQRIVDDGGQSIWFAARVVHSLEQARQVKAQLLMQDTVLKVGGIGLLFPQDEQRKVDRLIQIREALGPSLMDAINSSPAAVPNEESLSKLATSLQDLYQLILLAKWWTGQGASKNLSAWGIAWPTNPQAANEPQAGARQEEQPASNEPQQQQGHRLQEKLATLAGELHSATEAIRTLEHDPPKGQLRYQRLLEEYRSWRKGVAQQIHDALDPSPLTLKDVPEELMRPYVSRQGPLAGGYALEVHPRLPTDSNVQGPLDPVFLPGFLEDVAVRGPTEEEPFVTGVVVQIFRSGQLIKQSYLQAGAYALLVVVLLVWLDFRSFPAAALSLVPVGIGFAVTFGVMWLVGMRVNPANIIVLPLMFGIGVDSGVHMLHRFRQDPTSRPLGLVGGTGKGITITSLTTMIGFGAMLLADHRGIASLGFVLTLGIGLTLLSCWTVVPAWLEWRHHESGDLTITRDEERLGQQR